MSARIPRTAIVTLVAVLLAMIGAVLPSAARAAVVSAGASTAHPFSDPVWWPLSQPASMDCYNDNPGDGCQGVHHPVYLWDIIGQPGVNTQPVYAMGAGIVHVGETNAGCGHAQGRGNYVYIDHGNGVLTYYGHLGHIFVRTGQYVSPRTRIAYVGNSGYARCHVYPKLRYLMVALKHGGIGGNYVEVKHTYACSAAGARVTWPEQLASGSQSHWNAVHRKTPIPATSASRTCAPVPVRTAPAASGVTMALHGKATMYVHFARAASASRVGHSYVVLSEYHPSIRRWLPLRMHMLSPATTATRFGSLDHKRHYRAYVQFHNYVGYSAMSANRYASIGK